MRWKNIAIFVIFFVFTVIIKFGSISSQVCFGIKIDIGADRSDRFAIQIIIA